VRAIVTLLLWLTAMAPAFAEDIIHFVALAGIKPGKETQYDAFIKAVIPVWKRHGMSVVARARPVTPFHRHAGVVDLAVLRVERRSGFHAYSNDPHYKALQPQRLDAVEFLTVFDGKMDMSGEPGLRDSRMLRVWFVENPDAAWTKMLTGDLSEPLASALKIDLEIVGQVKGRLGKTLAKTRTIHIEAIDEIGPNRPVFPDGLYVVSGLRLR